LQISQQYDLVKYHHLIQHFTDCDFESDIEFLRDNNDFEKE